MTIINALNSPKNIFFRWAISLVIYYTGNTDKIRANKTLDSWINKKINRKLLTSHLFSSEGVSCIYKTSKKKCGDSVNLLNEFFSPKNCGKQLDLP